MAFLLGIALGGAISGLPYVIYGAEFPPLAITMIALALAAAGLAMLRPADKWLSGAGVGAGIVVPIVATIVVEYQRDPTSHNLAPLEILAGLALALPPALLGTLLGGLPGGVTFRPPVIGSLIAALGLGVAALHASVMLTRTAASESDAKAKIKSLIAAQDRVRSANLDRGLTCNLNELGARFDGPARRYVPGWLVGGVYGAGTQALAGDYAFTLLCSNQPKAGTSYMLSATPKREGLGRWVFCAEADGRLRTTTRRRYNHCLTEGVLVPD